jgi:hypothetical protein
MPFPITCAACHKTFSIADDVFERKVKGRVVTIKCKQCQAGIRVDGTKDTPLFSVSDSVHPPPVAPAPVAPAVPAVPEVAAPAAPMPTPAAVTAPAPAVPAAANAAAFAAPKQEPKATAVAARKAAPAPAATKAAAATSVAKAEPAVAPRAPLAAKAPAAAVTPKAPAAAVAVAKATVPGVPAAKALVAAAATEALWAVDYPDGEDRELTLLEIEKELAAGAITLSSLVWRNGMDEWLELGQVPELKSLTSPPQAKPAAPPDPPPQRPRAPSASALPELSATLPQPRLPQRTLPFIASPEPPARPPAPSAPVIDFASHDALKGAPPPPAPKPPQPTLSSIAEARAPTPPTFSTGAPALGGLTPGAFPASPAPVTPAFVPAAALVAAPFARPAPTPIGASVPVGNVEDWPKKSRMPLIIGAIALLAVGGLIFFLTRSSDELPAAAPISALPPSLPNTPSPARPSEPAPVPTLERTSPADPGPGSSAALQPPGSAPMATPNAGFAELFASGARGADEKHGVSGPAQRFDANAAKAALANAANQTAVCREKGGPTGKATVVVTFEPSGKVSSAVISDAPFAGTSSGACIAAALKRATVPAFSGLPGTATKIISIQ